MSEIDVEDAPVISVHDWPDVSPQQYDCGCVAKSYVTDRDALNGEKPFEMRLVSKCNRSYCVVRRTALQALLNREDLLPSREWPWTTEMLLGAKLKLDKEG